MIQYYDYKENKFNALEGKIITKIEGEKGDDSIKFFTEDGEVLELYHEQDCCEYVRVEDIVGNLDDLIGSTVIKAEEIEGVNASPVREESGWSAESYTWTFYDIATDKGFVTIRFYGESNGYYSERVNVRRYRLS